MVSTIGDGQHCWDQQPPTSWGSGRVAKPGGCSACPAEVTRGHCPHTALLCVHPSSKPHTLHRAQPRFCCFFPQSWVEAARGQGPRPLRSAKPRGGRRGDSRALPWLPRAQGTEVPSLQEGRRDHFGQEQPTYHPRPPVTNQGRRAGKVQLLGFCFHVVVGPVCPQAVAA